MSAHSIVISGRRVIRYDHAAASGPNTREVADRHYMVIFQQSVSPDNLNHPPTTLWTRWLAAITTTMGRRRQSNGNECHQGISLVRSTVLKQQHEQPAAVQRGDNWMGKRKKKKEKETWRGEKCPAVGKGIICCRLVSGQDTAATAATAAMRIKSERADQTRVTLFLGCYLMNERTEGWDGWRGNGW